jgi:polar amino acid transport system substrate-binding protein
MSRSFAHTALSLGLACATAFALSACSSGDAPGSAANSPLASIEIEGVGAINVNTELRALVPAGFLDSGLVKVATNAPFAPYELFTSDSDLTLIGLEPDLGHAVGALLGLDFAFTQQPFDGLIPGVQAGNYDVVMASFFDTAEREMVVDMVNYSASGSGLLVSAGNPEGYVTSADLCGASVGVQPGSAQVGIVQGFSGLCVSANKPEVTIKPYPLYSDELLALSTGLITAVVGDIPAMSYSLTQEANTGKFELVLEEKLPNGYDSAPVGIAVNKASGLTDAVAAAVTQLINDGTYDRILAKWGVTDIPIDAVTVNAASK